VYAQASLTASAVEEVFTIQWSECERNSNKNLAERRTVAYFRDFLQYLEGIYVQARNQGGDPGTPPPPTTPHQYEFGTALLQAHGQPSEQ